MLKPLTLSLSLAVALGLCSVSKAGLHDSGCTTCGLASPQGVVASPQGSYAARLRSSPAGRSTTSASGLKNLFHHEVTYEWVLKKKHVWHRGGGCSTPAPRPPRSMRPARATPRRRASMPPRRASTRPRRSTAPGSRSAFLPARLDDQHRLDARRDDPGGHRRRGSPARPRSQGRPAARAACCCPPPRATEVDRRVGLCRADRGPDTAHLGAPRHRQRSARGDSGRSPRARCSSGEPAGRREKPSLA